MERLSQGVSSVSDCGRFKMVWPCFIAVVIVSFLCYVPALSNGLVWDDDGYVTSNEHIRTLSVETIRWAFTTFYVNYWAPLTWLSLALDYAVWGLNPVGYHLTNAVIHAFNAGFFFLLAFVLLERYRILAGYDGNVAVYLNGANTVLCALLAALFFSLHPLRVESVAWVAERKDVLSFFFGVPTIIAYLLHTERYACEVKGDEAELPFMSSRYYWLAIVLYSLSLLSKSMLVSLPLVLMVLDWFPLKRFSTVGLKALLCEKALFLLLAVIASILTIASQQPVFISLESAGMLSRLLNAVRSVVMYLWMTVLPINLSPFYIHPGNITTIGYEYLLPILLFLIITMLCVLTVRRHPLFMTVWLIYLITLLPVLGFTAVGQSAMADRFTYLPGLPVALLFALGLTALITWSARSKLYRSFLLLWIAALLLASCFVTIRQISFWKDDVTLWTRVIALNPHSVGMAYFNRGCGYFDRGDFRMALPDLDEAIAIAQVKKYRMMHTLYVVRARTRKMVGDLEGAISDYGSAVASDESAMRSVYLRERGSIYKDQGKNDLSEEDFRMAAEIEANR